MNKIYNLCGSCGGTGVSNQVEGGICPGCNGKKTVQSGFLELDEAFVAKIDAIIATQALHTAELDYIHGKVTAIWNAVKP